jgi:hypothetical protein
MTVYALKQHICSYISLSQQKTFFVGTDKQMVNKSEWILYAKLNATQLEWMELKAWIKASFPEKVESLFEINWKGATNPQAQNGSVTPCVITRS